ncbi:MAG: HEAT repeat domain-containing protein [Thermodesulfovibrionales bacterium]|nr:HEAT repeat domain-containing protein [Thermodesulfovibrionales bacterium]
MSEFSTVRELIQTLLRTKKLMRMYPENNPMYIKAVNDMYEKFEEVFQSTGKDINLHIKQYEIFFEGEQVYHNPEKSDNIALFFFKDGIRELKFLKAIDKDELEAFMKIISLDEKDLVDDDIVTLLWERDFQHIKYVVDESILTEDEEYELRATEKVLEEQTSADELMKAYRDAMNADGVKATQIVPLTDDDLKILMKEFEKDSEPKLKKLVYILSEILYFGLDKKEFEEFLLVIKSVLEYAIRIAEIESAVEILKIIKTAIDDKELPYDSKIHLRKVIEYGGSEGIIKVLGEVIDRIEIDQNIVREYIEQLEKNAIKPLIEILGDLKNMKARKMIIDGLAILGKRDMQNLVRGLSDERWYVVRNIVYVLRLIGDKRALEYLLKTIKHPDMRVRREVIKTLGEIKAPQSVTILREHLNDPDPQIRIATVRALGSIHTEAAKRLLLQKLSTKEFLHRGLEEKKEYFEVLSTWRDQEVIDFFLKTLKKNTLFNRSKNYENRACAAYALGLIGSKEHLKILKKYADSGNPVFREHVRNAILRLEASHGRN